MNHHYAKLILCTFSLSLVLSGPAFAQNVRQLHVVETGDIHGAWFDEPYVDGGQTRNSLMSIKHYVDSLRAAVGAENVILVDAGDCLQGDNATYYFNNIADRSQPHPFPRLAKAIGYDAVVVGNHDIETGHEVYDKLLAEMEGAGVPWLAGNVLRQADGGTYFPLYKMVKKAGVNVAIIGFGNPNIREWLPENKFTGMDFLSLAPYAQALIDFVVKKEKPDVVVVVAHSGTGTEEPEDLESQSLYLFNTLKGVDVLVGGHDHARYIASKQGMVYLNAGAKAQYVGHAVIDLRFAGRRIVTKDVSGEICKIDKNKVDWILKSQFEKEFNAVKAFTNQKVGTLQNTFRSRDAYFGRNDYVSLVHRVQLSVPEAQVSFAAPLTYDGVVDKGTLVYNDMFTVYPYENELFVVRMKGSEIKAAMEFSYNMWIMTPGEHVLNIEQHQSDRYGSQGWSFVNRSYNLDSAGGLNYTVDVTKPNGSRVNITTLADGTAFDMDAFYNVAMTSYRASGGGESISEGAGLNPEQVNERIVMKYPAIRDMVYDFFKSHDEISSGLINDPSVVGTWKFVPEDIVKPLLDNDRKLLFE